MAENPDLRVVVSAIDGFVERVIKKLVLDIVAELTKAPSEGGTPVDTGWARANWIPRIGAPASGTDGERPAGTGHRRDESGRFVAVQRASSARQQEGVATVAATYKLEDGPVHVTNNVPYIVRLNEGSSQQAPAGFVQAAIARAVARANAVGSAA